MGVYLSEPDWERQRMNSLKVLSLLAYSLSVSVTWAYYSASSTSETAPGPAARDQLHYCPSQLQVGRKFSEWELSNDSLLLTRFPVDPEPQNFIRKVHSALFSQVRPTPFTSPPLLAAVADEVLTSILDLDPCDCVASEAFLGFVSGGLSEPSGVYLAHRYGGHQFGYWAGQLGDGRAVVVGEFVNKKGERWELQLKGSGKTPYSRHGDGRAVLRSSVREFLASEAMYHLGIPTSRAASLAVSEERAWRDQFYNGNIHQEKTAIVLRLAPSWFRIGSLEILHYSQEHDLLRDLVDFVIEQYFPHISGREKYVDFFATVVNQTAVLIARWLSVGFAHGVCNTDNFSLLSVTIDYGPFGFLDAFNPDFVPNSSDDDGRYSFRNQPHVGFFNLQKMFEAISFLFIEPELHEKAQTSLYAYPVAFNEAYVSAMRQKLGLGATTGLAEAEERLVVWLLEMMADNEADYTMCFRELSETDVVSLLGGNPHSDHWAIRSLQSHSAWPQWVELYTTVLKIQEANSVVSYSEGLRLERMQEINPRYILRNYMAERAIRLAERGDFSEVHRLYRVLRRPFVRQGEAERAGYTAPPPSWSKDLLVSCSS